MKKIVFILFVCFVLFGCNQNESNNPITIYGDKSYNDSCHNVLEDTIDGDFNYIAIIKNADGQRYCESFYGCTLEELDNMIKRQVYSGMEPQDRPDTVYYYSVNRTEAGQICGGELVGFYPSTRFTK